MDYSKFRLRSFTIQEPYCKLDCGSNNELPLKYASYKYSDVDALFYCYDICAISSNRNPPKITICTILRIDSTETPLGYARLRVDGDRTNDMPSYYRRPRMLDRAESGGPSIQNVDRCRRGFRKRPGTGYVSTDNVFAICCPYWPVEAEEWRKRKRFHGWPNEKLIARITRGGCHFVSKLRTWSSCDHTEWRFSFSKAELLLIHSWTDFQKFVFHITRFIKNRMSKDFSCDGNKVFKTYYFKTLMFWACEELSLEFWSEKNIDVCLYLFHQFYKCLNEKFCPNYFISECNIMSDLKDGGGYQTEIEALRKFLADGELVCNYVTNCEFYLGRSFEDECLEMTRKSFPVNEHLNGRLGLGLGLG